MVHAHTFKRGKLGGKRKNANESTGMDMRGIAGKRQGQAHFDQSASQPGSGMAEIMLYPAGGVSLFCAIG